MLPRWMLCTVFIVLAAMFVWPAVIVAHPVLEASELLLSGVLPGGI